VFISAPQSSMSTPSSLTGIHSLPFLPQHARNTRNHGTLPCLPNYGHSRTIPICHWLRHRSPCIEPSLRDRFNRPHACLYRHIIRFRHFANPNDICTEYPDHSCYALFCRLCRVARACYRWCLNPGYVRPLTSVVSSVLI
jgi:hypothetical protein